MAIDYAALRGELQTDPRGYGYNAPARNDSDMAARINAVRNGTNAPASPTAAAGNADGHVDVRRNDVASAEVILALDLADLPALPTNPNNAQLSTERRQLSYLEMLTNIPTVRLINDDGTDTTVIANLQSIFPAGTPSRTRLLALRTRYGSRAEELFGRGASVSPDDVGRALNQ